MIAEELRIGNWIEPTSGGAARLVTLTDFHEEYITGQAFFHMKPIPLTEEWLTRFGFECVNRPAMAFRKGEHYVTLQEVGNRPKWKLMIRQDVGDFEIEQLIYFVHHFQNLIFDLTGTELTINP